MDALMALTTPGCVFENTSPPSGVRYSGQDAVRAAWAEFFASSPAARFDTVEIIDAGERVVVRWKYTWSEPDGFVHGVDVFRIRDGLVAEKLSYVKRAEDYSSNECSGAGKVPLRTSSA